MKVIGSSGSGKTESLRRIGTEIIRHGIPLLVLNFHGDIGMNFVETVLLSAGRNSTMGINPLEVFFHDANRVGLVDQRMALVAMLKRAIPTLSQNQMAILERAIRGAYEYNGIFDDAPATWFDGQGRSRWS